MAKEVWTLCKGAKYTLFRLGPATPQLVTTLLNNYEVVDLGKGFTGILVKNPIKRLWHIFEETSGACVGTQPTRQAVLKMVRQDIAQCEDRAAMQEQVNQALQQRQQTQAVEESNQEFFNAFEGERREIYVKTKKVAGCSKQSKKCA